MALPTPEQLEQVRRRLGNFSVNDIGALIGLLFWGGNMPDQARLDKVRSTLGRIDVNDVGALVAILIDRLSDTPSTGGNSTGGSTSGQNANNVTITGGTIDGVVIGGNEPVTATIEGATLVPVDRYQIGQYDWLEFKDLQGNIKAKFYLGADGLLHFGIPYVQDMFVVESDAILRTRIQRISHLLFLPLWDNEYDPSSNPNSYPNPYVYSHQIFFVREGDGFALAHIRDNASAIVPSISNAPIPATPTSPGVTGEIRYSATHKYECIAPNTWRRIAIETW